MNISEYVSTYVNEYKNFMGITQFPEHIIKTMEVSKSLADSQGFGVVALTNYQPLSGEHTLSISTNLNLSKYILFHEFTHMLDSEEHVNGDPTRYMGLSGYTEYHASQVELAQLLVSNTIDSVPHFSMNRAISTLSGEMSVSRYIQAKHLHAIELFSRSDFPSNIDTLKAAFGVLYNYWGLRSICEMYASDFVETIENEAFLRFVPSTTFSPINNLMHGWLDGAKIELSIPLYVNAVFPIIKDYKLV